jgi:hypothetical protein
LLSHDGISKPVEKPATTALAWEIREDGLKRKEGINTERRFQRVKAHSGPITAGIEASRNVQREMFWLECALNPFPQRRMAWTKAESLMI